MEIKMEFKLGETQFQNLCYYEQLAVIERGRPMPDLNIEIVAKSRERVYRRQFNREIYSRNNWICGCAQKNAFFCFPCVLFCIDQEEKVWRKTGYRYLVHLGERMKKHENSRTHIDTKMKFALFGKVDVQAQLDPSYWINIQKHNEEVTKNRYVLSKIIDCIKFCGAFELAVRGNDNSGVFRGLVNFTSELDRMLSEHLKNTKLFNGASKNIQNDILDSMVEVCHEEILNQIKEAPFLALMVDETRDVSANFQMAIVFRYVTKEGTAVERFWTLIPQEQDAEALATAVFNVLDPIVLKGDRNKLIAQSYDGAAVVHGQNGGVQALIKEKYEHANFVHCYAHELNEVMSRACSINSQVGVFFEELDDISRFFTNSPKRIAVLDAIARRNNMFGSVPTRWNFNIHTVNVVYDHRASIIECLEQLEEDSNVVTCKEARGVRRILEDSDFAFWLIFFHYIMPHVEVVYNALKKPNMVAANAHAVVNTFEQNIGDIQKKIDSIIEQATTFRTAPSETKRKCPDACEPDHRVLCLDVCDVIIHNARERFAFTEHLVASSLLCSDKFEKYSVVFPEDKLIIATSAYSFLNHQRLQTELLVLYSNTECRTLHGAVSFLKFIISNNLEDTMIETMKLLQVLLTTPMITGEPERSFSALKRIKTFLRNCMCEDRLLALSMLSVEKTYISSIPDFNEKVIEKLAARNYNHIELRFKNVK